MSGTSKEIKGAMEPPRERRKAPLGVASWIIEQYFKRYHKLEIKLYNNIIEGPGLALYTHLSILDFAYHYADPFRPPSVPVVKEELMHIPIVSEALRRLGAIPVARNGEDMGAVRKILATLKQGGSVSIASEGTRSRTGRLGPLNETSVKIALWADREGIPVVPFAAEGTYEALPSGVWIPRREKIVVRSGPPIVLRDSNSEQLQVEPAARAIRMAQAALLPARNQPLPGSPDLARIGSR